MDDIMLDDSLSEDDTITAESVLRTLEEAWLNEKLSPELLQHKMEHVDCMLEQIHQMEENIKKLEKSDFRITLHKLELERIRYLITSYLRTRIEKIESFTLKILEEEGSRDPGDRYLSPNESKFAREYINNMNTHFQSILDGMPPSMQNISVNQIMIKPNLESHVFVKAKRNVPSVIIAEQSDSREEEVSLDEHSQHILPYRPIAEFVKSGAVQLI